MKISTRKLPLKENPSIGNSPGLTADNKIFGQLFVLMILDYHRLLYPHVHCEAASRQNKIDRTESDSFQMMDAGGTISDFDIAPVVSVQSNEKVPRRAVDYVYFLNRYVGIFGSVAFLFWFAYGVDIALCKRSSLDGVRISRITLGQATLLGGREILPVSSDWSISKIIADDQSDWVTIISIDYILMIRVLALYSKDARLSTCLTLMLMLEAVIKLALLIYLELIEHNTIGVLAKNVTVCGEDSPPAWQLGMIDWMAPMTYGAILMILALYKAAEYWKVSAGFKGFMLVKVLIRDQVLYFMLAIACSIFAIIEFRVVVSNDFAAAILTALGNSSFLTILGNRMLFNLKEAGERGQNEGTSYRSPSRAISDIDFAEQAPPQRESESGIGGDDGQA
ncbi:hypothetical protein ACEPAF_9973 [Sanghuangporus sanghuang]